LPDPSPPPREDGRLPPGVTPLGYDLDLAIDPTATSILGRVRIKVKVDSPTRAIVLHARALEVLTAAVSSHNGKQWAKTTNRRAHHGKEQPEELVLVLERPVPAGNAEIDLQYDAPYDKTLRGAYRVDQDGKSYVFTQFEPNDARRAFPCFDEPGFKVPFHVTLTVPEGNLAFSNMPELKRTENRKSGLVSYEFQTSPALPTYLVAFAVGPLEVRDGARDPVPIRLIALPGKTALGGLGLEAARAELALLTEYFGVPYPYPKLDLVAVPEFGSGAMENAGLVTFREERLLLDEKRASLESRRDLASIMAHELAHQWFGNLVTMKWWDDIWLNEGFATWMGTKITDRWHAYGAELEGVSRKHWVMGIDSLASARKIRQPVRSSSEALEAFDGITYVKGASVLGMVERWLGEDVMQKGIRDYIQKHRFGNAAAADLFGALSAAGNKDVAAVMGSFTDQTGVPLIELKESCKPGPKGATLDVEIRQSPYRRLGSPELKREPWTFPVCRRLRGASGTLTESCVLVKGAVTKESVPVKECPTLALPNARESGYFRTLLGAAELSKLAKARVADERERIGLVGNAWALVQSGKLTSDEWLGFLDEFSAEPNPMVWDRIVGALKEQRMLLADDKARAVFEQRVSKLLSPMVKKLGYAPRPGDSEEMRQLRQITFGALGDLGNDAPTLKEATKLTTRWLADPNSIDADIADIALPLAARRGDAALFDELFQRYEKAATPELQVRALFGLSGFEDPKLVERLLDLVIEKKVKVHQLRYVFPALYERPTTARLAYAYLRVHFEDITKLLPGFVVARLPWVIASLCDETVVRQADEFFRPRLEKIEGASKSLDQALDAGKLCAALAKGKS
jgi:aminopeptidase N